MIAKLKQTARQTLTAIQKAFAKNIDHLYSESPYNKLIAELDNKNDFAKYKSYTQFRDDYESKVLALNAKYVKLAGVTYHLNAFKDVMSLREASTDDSGLNSRMRFCLSIIKQYFSGAKKVYLSEHDTLFHQVLAKETEFDLTTSYYKPGAALHQDLTALTYPDNSFDLSLSFEDLEHIPEYKKAIAELYRVTKPGGHVLLSTPFVIDYDKTLVRATINKAGEITHLLEPEYHGDPVIPQGILCFYHFGWDLLDDFRTAGFSDVKIITGYDTGKMMLGLQLFIMAQK
ncbi:class I SAM-dependent methyltransferase [Mucilaginibacter jinjuensis]|uniref:Class I SAM-dependent methyltransferase n=1 Tax=Mucilaginibacter jinjuensis TaxID=1176721 RepID=A0ABY7T7T3_9SPHI|nr:class I SAM-dependent methyltransferase [Mucilaginibacter jinjuensis]WCT12416.1 class I SAM-dependent methyltransferase [Mucilaginibacter jinjuensis]